MTSLPGTENAQRILIIEDDPDILNAVMLNIEILGFQVEHAADGQTGLAMALSKDYHLVILDLVLPKLGGLEVCRAIRKEKYVLPILMLTSKSDELSRVLGLELGADDYLPKPFSVPEFIARIRALLRRVKVSGSKPIVQIDQQIKRGELLIDLYGRKVMKNGDYIDLTAIEFDLLVVLASYPGRAFSKEEILDHVWGYIAAGHEKTLTSQMSRLRKKIEIDADNPKYIKTLWGVGYQFAELRELEGES